MTDGMTVASIMCCL